MKNNLEKDTKYELRHNFTVYFPEGLMATIDKLSSDEGKSRSMYLNEVATALLDKISNSTFFLKEHHVRKRTTLTKPDKKTVRRIYEAIMDLNFFFSRSEFYRFCSLWDVLNKEPKKVKWYKEKQQKVSKVSSKVSGEKKNF